MSGHVLLEGNVFPLTPHPLSLPAVSAAACFCSCCRHLDIHSVALALSAIHTMLHVNNPLLYVLQAPGTKTSMLPASPRSCPSAKLTSASPRRCCCCCCSCLLAAAINAVFPAGIKGLLMRPCNPYGRCYCHSSTAGSDACWFIQAPRHPRDHVCQSPVSQRTSHPRAQGAAAAAAARVF
jgi:hypothetical protein